MDYLLDTHIALWFFDGSPRLPQEAVDLILNSQNRICTSFVSAWEVSIKRAKAPDRIPRTGVDFLEECDNQHFDVLPIDRGAIEAFESLDVSMAEPLHKDPFDRMLIAQARSNNMLLLTHDKSFGLYHEPLVRLC